MKPAHDVWTDPELRELVESEPELAALADALAHAGPGAGARRGWRRLPHPRAVSLAALLAAAVAVCLVAPWQRSHGTLADLALAAIGSDPVLHVVTETPADAQLLEIASGAAQPVTEQDEIWYDADLGLRRDLTTVGSTIVDDELDTPQGGFTPRGIVYDCTWIAAHPVEATKAGVSCNASGDNGTTPHAVPRPKPTLDPGLTGFLDGYRQALASGQAQDAGTGLVDGQTVDWLTFATSGGGTEKVALDPSSHKPLLLENGQWSEQIESIETVPYEASDFARPTPDEIPDRPSSTHAADGDPVALDAAAIAAAIPNALWAGSELDGLPLALAEQQPLTASFADGSPTQTGTGLELVYGTLTPNGLIDRSQPSVEIQEAPSSTLSTMWGFVRGADPPAGSVYSVPLGGSGSGGAGDELGFTVIDGLYVTIQTYGAAPGTLLDAARALTPAG